MLTSFRNSVWQTLRRTDWVLFLLLVLFCNQAMLVVKLAGILLVYLLRFNVRLGLLRRRLPLFYGVMPLLGALAWAVHVRDDARTYAAVFGVGALMWLLCLAASHQIRLSVERRGGAAVDATLRVFTFANLAFSVAQVVVIARHTGVLNPYSYDVPFPYGMSTGDHVFGILGENSYYNMMVSAMLTLYFLFRRDVLFCLLAATSMLMVFSNGGTVLVAAVLVVLTLGAWLKKGLTRHPAAGVWRAFPNGRARWLAPALLGYIVLFYAVFSPQNFTYTREATLSAEEPIELQSVKPGTVAKPAQQPGLRWYASRLRFRKYEPGHALSASAQQADLLRREQLTRWAIAHMKGKKLSLLQTGLYLQRNPMALVFGSGMGRFSSLTAHRVSGGDTGRLFSRLPRYETPLYTENHGLITKYRIEGGGALLANLNWPECLYNQIPGEYGLLGVLAFLLLYAGHWLRRARRLSYGWWTAGLAVPFGIWSYLFDALCPIVFLELLLELDTHPSEALQAAQA